MRLTTLAAVPLFAVAVIAAPVPRNRGPIPPFPLKVGDTREYEWRTGDKAEYAYSDAVTKSDPQPDGSTRVTISRTRSDQGNTLQIGLSVSATGISRISYAEKTLDEPVLLLKLPATVGTKWESDGAKYEVTAAEDVTVPAGKYQTAKVEMAVGNSKTTLWFASEVGLVRMKNGESDRVLELKAFKPGK